MCSRPLRSTEYAIREVEPVILGMRDAELNVLAENINPGIAFHAMWRRIVRVHGCYICDIPKKVKEEFCVSVETRLGVKAPKWWARCLTSGDGTPVQDYTLVGDRVLVWGDEMIIPHERSIVVSTGVEQIEIPMSSIKKGVRGNDRLFPLDNISVSVRDGKVAVVLSSNNYGTVDYCIACFSGSTGELLWRHDVPIPAVGVSGYNLVSCACQWSSSGSVCVFGKGRHCCQFVIGVFDSGGDCMCVFNDEMHLPDWRNRKDLPTCGSTEFPKP